MNKLLLFGLASLLTLAGGVAQAQSYSPQLNKENPREWGEPVEFTVTSKAFEKKGIAPVPMKLQVRFKKKIVMGCQYEYQLTNASDKQAVDCEDMYAVSDQKYNEKLKPGQSVIFLANTMTRCGDKKAKDDTPCLDCQPSFYIPTVSPK